MGVSNLIVLAVLTAVTPLTDDQRARIESAADGRGYREPAFEAMLENVRQWTPGVGDAAVRLNPDFEAMLGDPGAYRGELCRLAGRIQQQRCLDPPHQTTVEWFLRDESKRPIQVYVDGLPANHSFRDGQAVTLLARFYKRTTEIARDGQLHHYPAFVGGWPAPAASGEDQWARLWAVTVPVLVMFVVLLVLLVYARRGRAPLNRFQRGRARFVETVTAEESLPEDPADALKELRRRAETAE